MEADPGDRDRRVRIERPIADDSFDGAGSGSWDPVKEVWASVVDALPSRSEKLTDGINLATRPARVRILRRDGITSSMRFALLRKQSGVYVVERYMQIVSGPAFKRDTNELEFMVEDYTPAGNGA